MHDRDRRSPRPIASIAVLLTVLSLPGQTNAGQEQTTNDRWQYAVTDGLPTAIATPCNDCSPSLILRCLTPHRGLLQLKLPGASVANGRAGASKQIRITIGDKIERRRAITDKSANGFIPTIEIGHDDSLLSRLAAGRVLKLNFYGQRRYIGLDNAAQAIGSVRTACQPLLPSTPGRHCTWSVTIACSPTRAAAQRSGADLPGSFIRATPGGYCATFATDDLVLAKARATQTGGTLERSCLR